MLLSSGGRARFRLEEIGGQFPAIYPGFDMRNALILFTLKFIDAEMVGGIMFKQLLNPPSARPLRLPALKFECNTVAVHTIIPQIRRRIFSKPNLRGRHQI